eukprot:NODE_662_length_4925_cov_0.478243.p2 type:complete len:315 gc:universal NODE_662_length_4925_cov_0.478243:3620-4564(+)
MIKFPDFANSKRGIMKYLWLGFYIISSIILTLHSKSLLKNFNYPFLLTALHSTFSYLGVSLLHVPTQITAKQWKTIYYFSVLYTINIAVSNWSLSLTSVHFHQIIRSATPFITVILNLWWGKYTPISKCLSLLPVVVGVMLSTSGDITYTWFGCLLVWVGVVLSSLKGIITNQVMVGPLKLHPMDAILKLCPLATAQCLFVSCFNGEALHLFQNPPSWTLVFMLICNAFIAYFLNVASFTANKMNGALTMTVGGNIKQVVTIILSVVLFDAIITPLNGIGIVVTVFGGILYSWTDYLTKKSDYLPLNVTKSGKN